MISTALAAFAAASCGPSETPEEPSDVAGPVLLVGPRFYTGDPARPWAEALVVHDGRIAEVIEVEARADASMPRVEIPGALAVPGLVDAHAHLLGYALAQRQVDLVGAESLGEALDRVRAFAEDHPDDAWVLGRGWDQNDWPDSSWPGASDLDVALPDRPAALRRIDGHAMWVNRTALEVAGIDASTPDPPGGLIRRDDRGEPTGILIDAAMELVSEHLPEPDEALIENALVEAGERLAALGLTGLHEMGMEAQVWRVLTRLSEEGRFPLRVVAYASHEDQLAQTMASEGAQHAGRVRLVGVKLYADGALGSRGARLIEPYADAPDTRGLWVTEPEALRAEIASLMRAGLQPAVHAIGDAANRAVFEAIDEALVEMTADGDALVGLAARPRVEHVQVVAVEDLDAVVALHERMRETRHDGPSPGLVLSMQPTHATSDMPWAGDRLGEARLEGAYAWKTFLERGLPLAFGSDFPVESADPRLGLHAAVARQDAEGRPEGGWRPEEGVDLEAALHGFTAGAAWSAGLENELGVMREGAWCDLTVFAEDLFALPPRSWIDVNVSATMVGGELVHELR